MENPVETTLRAQLRQAEEALGRLMEDVREAGKALDDCAEGVGPWPCSDEGTFDKLMAICDALANARDRANAAWAKWKRDDPR